MKFVQGINKLIEWGKYLKRIIKTIDLLLKMLKSLKSEITIIWSDEKKDKTKFKDVVKDLDNLTTKSKNLENEVFENSDTVLGGGLNLDTETIQENN